MPKKPYLTNSIDKYILIYYVESTANVLEFFTASSAVSAYRKYREAYGDRVCLTKVVLNYGEEI